MNRIQGQMSQFIINPIVRVCLSACSLVSPICLPAFLPVCVSISRTTWLFACRFVCLPVCLPGCLSVCLPAHNKVKIKKQADISAACSETVMLWDRTAAWRGQKKTTIKLATGQAHQPLEQNVKACTSALALWFCLVSLMLNTIF